MTLLDLQIVDWLLRPSPLPPVSALHAVHSRLVTQNHRQGEIHCLETRLSHFGKAVG